MTFTAPARRFSAAMPARPIAAYAGFVVALNALVWLAACHRGLRA